MKVKMKFLLSYFSLDFKNCAFKKVAVNCRQDLINVGVELFTTYLDKTELVLLKVH